MSKQIRPTAKIDGEPYLFAHVWGELHLTQGCFPEASQIHLHSQVGPRCTAELVGNFVGFPVTLGGFKVDGEGENAFELGTSYGIWHGWSGRKWSRTSLYLSAKVYKDPAKYVRQTDIDKLPELIRKLAKSRGSYHEKRCSRTFASITTTGVPYSTENAGRRGNCTRRQHSCSSISYRSKR